MQALNKVVDKFQRRTMGLLQNDGIFKVVVELKENSVLLLLFLDSDPDVSKYTELEVRYQRMFSDDPEYTIKVYPRTNIFQLNKNHYNIWKQGSGYLV